MTQHLNMTTKPLSNNKYLVIKLKKVFERDVFRVKLPANWTCYLKAFQHYKT
jgi:hypothetical protein